MHIYLGFVFLWIYNVCSETTENSILKIINIYGQHILFSECGKDKNYFPKKSRKIFALYHASKMYYEKER